MLRRSKAISKKRDRPAPARGRHQVARRGGAPVAGERFQSGLGGVVGVPGLKPRAMAKDARAVTALLTRALLRGALVYCRGFELSGERSRSRIPAKDNQRMTASGKYWDSGKQTTPHKNRDSFAGVGCLIQLLPASVENRFNDRLSLDKPRVLSLHPI